MPNWCQNQLTVIGATPKLRAWLKDGGFSFQRMKPVSPTKTKYAKPIKPWRKTDAQCSAWGTKWDLNDNEQSEAASELLECGNAWFDTAWSPPIEALTALSRRFPDDTFILDYHEPSMGFAGHATFVGGECDDQFTQEPSEVNHIAREIFGADWDEDEDSAA